MRLGWLIASIIVGLTANGWSQELPNPPGPSTFKQALLKMSEQLSAEQTVERLLKGRSVLEIARWWESMSPSEDEAIQVVTEAGAQDLNALQNAYLGGGIEAAAKELERQGVTAEKLLPAIAKWARNYPPRTFIERSLFGDLSEYELWRVLSGQPSLAERLAQFQSWIREGWLGGRAWKTAMAKASLEEMGEALMAARLDEGTRWEVWGALGVRKYEVVDKAYRLQDPQTFAQVLRQENFNAERFRDGIADLANQITADEVVPLLRAREEAMSRWFQTTGPGVQAVYVGWYQRPPEGVNWEEATREVEQLPEEGVPFDPALEVWSQAEPEFILVFYADGTVRAAWRTKEGDPKKVIAYYQAKRETTETLPTTLELKVDYGRLGLLARAQNLKIEGLRTKAKGVWLLAKVGEQPLVLKRHVGYVMPLL